MLEQAVVGEVRRERLQGAHNDVERNVVVYDFRDARGSVQGCIFYVHNHQQINVTADRRLPIGPPPKQ